MSYWNESWIGIGLGQDQGLGLGWDLEWENLGWNRIGLVLEYWMSMTTDWKIRER